MSACFLTRACDCDCADTGYEDLARRGSTEEAEKYNLKLAHETVRVAVCGVMESILDAGDRYTSMCFCVRAEWVLRGRRFCDELSLRE